MRITNDESSRHGAAMPRRRLRDGGHVQGGGAVWRRGGVDGRSDMVSALIAARRWVSGRRRRRLLERVRWCAPGFAGPMVTLDR